MTRSKKPRGTSAPQVTPPPPSAKKKVTDEARAGVSTGVETLKLQIERLSEEMKKETEAYDRDKASHLAWVTKMLASVMGEVRKMDEAEQKQAASITVDQVLTWARSQSADKRAHLARELAAIDAGGSVLA